MAKARSARLSTTDYFLMGVVRGMWFDFRSILRQNWSNKAGLKPFAVFIRSYVCSFRQILLPRYLIERFEQSRWNLQWIFTIPYWLPD